MLHILLLLALHAALAWAGVRIVERTGHGNRWVGLIMGVPLLQLVLIFWLAFSDWPVLQGPTDDG